MTEIKITDKISARQVAFDYAFRFYVDGNPSFNRDKLFKLANEFYEYLTKDINLPDIYQKDEFIFKPVETKTFWDIQEEKYRQYAIN